MDALLWGRHGPAFKKQLSGNGASDKQVASACSQHRQQSNRVMLHANLISTPIQPDHRHVLRRANMGSQSDNTAE